MLVEVLLLFTAVHRLHHRDRTSGFLCCKRHIGVEIHPQLHCLCSCQGVQFKRHQKKAIFEVSAVPGVLLLNVFTVMSRPQQTLLSPSPVLVLKVPITALLHLKAASGIRLTPRLESISLCK